MRRFPARFDAVSMPLNARGGGGKGSNLRTRCSRAAQTVRTGRLVAALLACALLAGCQSRQIDNTMLVAPEEVSFSQDVLPLFARSCDGAGCHVGERTSGVALASYQQVTTSVGEQYGVRIVAAGDNGVRPLIDKLGRSPRFGDRMPLGQTPLAPDEIATIRAWLDAGTPDN